MPKQMSFAEWILLILLSVLWGGSFFFVEVALRELSPLTLVFCRVGLAAIALTTFVYLCGHKIPLSFKLWQEFAVMGTLNNFIPFSLIVWGQTQIDAGLASILNATTPVFTVVLAHYLTQDEKLTPNRFLGIAFSVGGVIVLIGTETLSGFNLKSLGQIAVLIAACSYGFAGIYGRRFRSIFPAVTAAGMLICSATMMFPLALIFDRPWSTPNLTTGWAIIGLSLLSTALAYIIYFRILASAGATNLMLVTFLIPASAIALSVFVLGEPFQRTEFVGMLLIFTGLAAIDGRLITQMKILFTSHEN